jgi:transposase
VLTEQIQHYDVQIEHLAEKKYPQTRLLRQVKGVGPLIALTYVLTIEDPARFRRSREVGSFLGLRPKQRESGDSAPQLGITKGGNNHLRWLLGTQAGCAVASSVGDGRSLRSAVRGRDRGSLRN